MQLRVGLLAHTIHRLDCAKLRQEVAADLDPGLIFDTMSGIMLYALIFPPPTESWATYVRRALDSIL